MCKPLQKTREKYAKHKRIGFNKRELPARALKAQEDSLMLITPFYIF
jgi:hypothetical protein